MRQMEDIKALKNRINHLEAELKVMRKTLGVRRERKDPGHGTGFTSWGGR
jgi:hypothetical protein